MFVIIAWAKFLAPKAPPPSSQTNKPAATAPANAGQTPPAASSTGSSSANPPATSMTAAAAATAPAAAKSDKQERTIVVENGLYHVGFSSTGGVVKNWQLKKYKDDARPQRVLDLVHQDASQAIGGWPLSVS